MGSPSTDVTKWEFCAPLGWKGFRGSPMERVRCARLQRGSDSSEVQNSCESKCESLACSSFRNGDGREVGESKAYFATSMWQLSYDYRRQNSCVGMFFLPIPKCPFASLFFFLSLSPFFVLWLFFRNPSRLQLCSPFFYSFLVRYCFTAFICLFDLLLFADKIFWLLCVASHVDTSPHKQSLEWHSHRALSSPVKSLFVMTSHSSGSRACLCYIFQQDIFYFISWGEAGKG